MATRTVDLGPVVGPQGPAGPNEITSATETNLNGVLMGDGSNVGVKPVDSAPTQGSPNLVMSAGVKSAIDSAASKMVGRNLLDNPWFTVNQREAPNGTTIGHLAYGVDRWFGDGASYKPNADGVIVDGVICQKFENTAWLIGKTVTVSVLYANGTISYGTGTFAVGTITFGDGGQVAIPTGASQVNFTPGDKTKVVRALKLELGSVSTLANDAPPNYAEELAKCQRYAFVPQIPSGSQYLALGFNLGAFASTTLNALIVTPVTMRSEPTASGSLHSIRGNGVQINSSISIGTALAPVGNTVIVPINTSYSFSALTMGYGVLFSSLVLSADL